MRSESFTTDRMPPAERSFTRFARPWRAVLPARRPRHGGSLPRIGHGLGRSEPGIDNADGNAHSRAPCAPSHRDGQRLPLDLDAATIFGRRQEALDAALADLGPNARAVKGSVSDLADLDRLYAAVKAERGTLDIVFANAGAGSPLALGKITADHIDETFDTNVKGTIFTVQKALPLMGRGGSIILTGSSAGTTGAPAMSAYSASKAAVRNLARTWAEDLKGTGIRVNVLSPGATATELAKEALGEEGQKVFASMTPLQRMADPAEIGAVAAFLASSDSSFMTASEVAVDGGLAQL
jgi:NAD(P)-dependent dehydrogenase (short-subunit alcohol dehydrogenase family)